MLAHTSLSSTLAAAGLGPPPRLLGPPYWPCFQRASPSCPSGLLSESESWEPCHWLPLTPTLKPQSLAGAVNVLCSLPSPRSSSSAFTPGLFSLCLLAPALVWAVPSAWNAHVSTTFTDYGILTLFASQLRRPLFGEVYPACPRQRKLLLLPGLCVSVSHWVSSLSLWPPP